MYVQMVSVSDPCTLCGQGGRGSDAPLFRGSRSGRGEYGAGVVDRVPIAPVRETQTSYLEDSA